MFLTSTGLQNFQIFPCDNFSFIVGAKTYTVPLPCAIFFSKKIANFLSIDPTTRSYKIKANDPKDSFEIVKDIMLGNPFTLPSNDIQATISLCLIAHELENQELVQILLDNPQSEMIDIVTKLTILPNKQNISQACISFQNLPLENIPLEILKILMNRNDISIPSEDWLFEKVVSLMKINSKYNELLDYIDISFLSKEKVIKFCTYVDPSTISHHMWALITKRLSLDVEAPWGIRGIGNKKSRYIGLQNGEPFKGVFYYLYSKKHPQTPTQSGAVTITCSNPDSDNSLSLDDLIVYNDQRQGGFFRTGGTIPNPYIEITFQHHLLIMSGYSIKSNSRDYGYRYLKAWTISGYNEENDDWDVIDMQTINDYLVGYDKIFSTQVECNTQYRKFRLTMIEPNSNHDMRLCLQEIEFFGSLFSSDP